MQSIGVAEPAFGKVPGATTTQYCPAGTQAAALVWMQLFAFALSDAEGSETGQD